MNFRNLTLALILSSLFACGSGSSSSGGLGYLVGTFKGSAQAEIKIGKIIETKVVNVTISANSSSPITVNINDNQVASPENINNIDVISFKVAANLIYRQDCSGDISLLLNKTKAPELITLAFVKRTVKCNSVDATVSLPLMTLNSSN